MLSQNLVFLMKSCEWKIAAKKTFEKVEKATAAAAAKCFVFKSICFLIMLFILWKSFS